MEFGAGDAGNDAGREAYKRQNRSADSILDERDTYDNNGNLQCDGKPFTTSCPHLNPPGVFFSTQTDSTAHNSRRPPQIGANKYTIANTSTGSSTSGAVDLDVSSSSNKSEPQGVTAKKGVLIIDTDPDPLVRHRTPSFKRAIERGPSAESNTSFDLCDLVSTSPDASPEHSELPPYPYAGRDAFRVPSSDSSQPQHQHDVKADTTFQEGEHRALLKTITPDTSLEDTDEMLNLDPQHIADLK